LTTVANILYYHHGLQILLGVKEMKVFRQLGLSLAVLTAVLLSRQPVKADDWRYGQNQVQSCQWVLTGYNQYGSAVYQQVCPSNQTVYSDYSTPYYVDRLYPNSNYNHDYNRSGFSIQFGTGGGFNHFPFFFNNGGHHGGRLRHH
jgi:hypothetical protein